MRAARRSRGFGRLALLAAALAAACAEVGGDPDDPDVALIPPDDDVQVEADTGVVVEADVGEEPDAPVDPPDAGYDAGRDVGRDVGTDVGFDVGRDAGVVVDVGFDAGFDVPRDAGADVGVDVPRDVGVDVPRDAGCVGPTSQTCGACGTQTRTCAAGAWTSWGACAEPTIAPSGSWRVAITPVGGGAAINGATWISGAVGGAVDAYGYADLTAVVTDACARRITYTKRYVVGSSTNTTFRYTGTWTAGPPPAFAGTWVDASAATNTSTFTAQWRTGRAPTTAAGAWRVTVPWTVNSTSLTVGPTGGITGTMVDVYGSATVQGALDLADGTITFIKRYTSGTSVDQQWLYTGTVNAAGTAITAGRWSDQGTSGVNGTWTAER